MNDKLIFMLAPAFLIEFQRMILQFNVKNIERVFYIIGKPQKITKFYHVKQSFLIKKYMQIGSQYITIIDYFCLNLLIITRYINYFYLVNYFILLISMKSYIISLGVLFFAQMIMILMYGIYSLFYIEARLAMAENKRKAIERRKRDERKVEKMAMSEEELQTIKNKKKNSFNNYKKRKK